MRGHSRRTFLATLGGGLAITGAGLLVPRSVLAGDLSLQDRLDLLYSNKFHFNRQGRPQITVGLMTGQTEVAMQSAGGVNALPSGEGGTAIEGGARWRVRRLSGHAAEQRFAIGVQSMPADNLRAADAAASHWKKVGVETRELEVGALFGIGGHTLDTRRIILVTDDFSSEQEAKRRARVLEQHHGALGRLYPTVRKRSTGRIEATDLDTGVKIRAEGVMWFAPRSGKFMSVDGVEHHVTAGKRGRENRSYRGQIYVTVDRDGKLAVVNVADEVELLYGLVPAEMFASAPINALRAQAVAARGQLLTKLGTRHLADPFLLCAHQHCQVYAGRHSEQSRTNRAVDDTIGRVLMRPNQRQLVDTVYSANSGGHTEHNELVWPSPPDPQLRAKADPMIAKRHAKGISAAALLSWITDGPKTYSTPKEAFMKSYRWTTTVDPNTVAGRPGVHDGFGTLKSIEVLARGRSGRATAAKLRSNRGEVDIHGEFNIRKALGGLRSSMFVVDGRDERGHLRLHGGGYGHGVGMCQHGAMGMAAAGKSYGTILAHYYSGAKLNKLW